MNKKILILCGLISLILVIASIVFIFDEKKIDEKKIDFFYYRLSDMVKNKDFRDLKDGRTLHYKLYPSSIASQYMKMTDKDNDFDVLLYLVTNYALKTKPKKNELIIHLRVGDILESSKYSVDNHLKKQLPYHKKFVYVKPLSYYKQIIDKYKNLKSITLVAGGCKASKFVKSKEYISKIKKFFEKHNYKVNIRLGNPPDDDFVYMCYATHFVPSGGGFSRLIKKLNGMIYPPYKTEK